MRKNKQIRIISGDFGGRLIDTPKTDATQPMGDRERMAIFNRIREDIAGKKILDAFAGSGALGLESLGLGASAVDFLEINPEAIRTIKQNSQKLGAKAKIIRKVEDDYDIIFADPPYDNMQYELVERIVEHLRDGGIFVLSHPANSRAPEFQNLQLISDKKYAGACIKIFVKSAA